MLHAVVEEHDDLISADLLASVQDQLDHGVEVGLAGRQVPWVDVVGLETGEEEFTRSHIITIKNKVVDIIKWNVEDDQCGSVGDLPMRALHQYRYI